MFQTQPIACTCGRGNGRAAFRTDLDRDFPLVAAMPSTAVAWPELFKLAAAAAGSELPPRHVAAIVSMRYALSVPPTVCGGPRFPDHPRVASLRSLSALDAVFRRCSEAHEGGAAAAAAPTPDASQLELLGRLTAHTDSGVREVAVSLLGAIASAPHAVSDFDRVCPQAAVCVWWYALTFHSLPADARPSVRGHP